jgi:hypothetical protein
MEEELTSTPKNDSTIVVGGPVKLKHKTGKVILDSVQVNGIDYKPGICTVVSSSKGRSYISTLITAFLPSRHLYSLQP